MHYLESIWTVLKTKDVLDSDGFYTDYTLYTDGSTFICIFGDRDLYSPDDTEADFECDDEKVATEWFDNYRSYDEEYDFI